MRLGTITGQHAQSKSWKPVEIVVPTVVRQTWRGLFWTRLTRLQGQAGLILILLLAWQVPRIGNLWLSLRPINWPRAVGGSGAARSVLSLSVRPKTWQLLSLGSVHLPPKVDSWNFLNKYLLLSANWQVFSINTFGGGTAINITFALKEWSASVGS